jgi:AAA15 family ATPase/GTPase
MITEFRIKNFKSILEHTLELGRVNVFIGENGSGKTNILEAFAVAGAAIDGKLGIEELYTRGIRVAKPSVMVSSFSKMKSAKTLELDIREKKQSFGLALSPKDVNDFTAIWETSTFNVSASIRQKLQKAQKKRMRALHVGSLPDPLSSALPPAIRALEEFCIYNLNALALRGIHNVSRRTPLGLNGENLDVVLSYFTPRQLAELERYSKIIPWFDKLILDPEDELKFKGHKLGRSTSRLYFQDRFMRRGNNVFSAESANEGILHILFYLALFLGDKTPFVFGIDNIETALNPQLCRDLMKSLAALAKTHGKQALITTHNPAILDGLNLHDDGQRLFVVYRNDAGHTTTKRIKLKPETGEPRLKLSELWMRGHLGGIPKAF